MTAAMIQRLEAFISSRAAVVLAVAVAMVWGFWSAPLYDLDEGAFTEATREMIASGNYVSIFLNGEPRHDKPILIYWLQAGSVHLFGLSEFALRLPSVLAGLAWVWALFAFARRHTDQATAAVAALLLALSLYVGLISRAAVADALLNLFLALAMFDIYNHFERPSRIRLARVFVWLGLGFLTKGPVAVVFPVLVSGLFYLSYGRWREWLKLALDPRGLLIFLAIVLPWHVAVYLDTGWAFFEGFYLDHNINRYSEPMEGHGGSIFYFLLVAPLIIMPFGGWFLLIFRHVGEALSRPLDRYLWLWFFSVLAVFSLSGTKLPHYLLYGMSGVFLLMAQYREKINNPWIGLAPALLLFGLFATLPQLFGYLAGQADRLYEQTLFQAGAERLAGWSQAVCVVAFMLTVAIVFLKTALWQRLLLLGFLQASLIAVLILPAVMEVLQGGVKAAALYAREHGKELVLYRTFQPSLSVYREQIIRRRPARPGQWVYMRVDRVDDFLAEPSPYRKEIVFSRPPATLVAIEEKGSE